LDSKQKRLYSKAGEAVQLYSYKTTEEGQRETDAVHQVIGRKGRIANRKG
jgi:hypothetical protein